MITSTDLWIPAVMNLPVTGANKYQTTLPTNVTLDDDARYLYIMCWGANLFYALWDSFVTITTATGANSTWFIAEWVPTLIELQNNAWIEKLTKLTLAVASGTVAEVFIYTV